MHLWLVYILTTSRRLTNSRRLAAFKSGDHTDLYHSFYGIDTKMKQKCSSALIRVKTSLKIRENDLSTTRAARIINDAIP